MDSMLPCRNSTAVVMATRQCGDTDPLSAVTGTTCTRLNMVRAILLTGKPEAVMANQVTACLVQDADILFKFRCEQALATMAV